MLNTKVICGFILPNSFQNVNFKTLNTFSTMKRFTYVFCYKTFKEHKCVAFFMKNHNPIQQKISLINKNVR